MNTSLTFRKSFVLTLAVLVLVLAGAAFLGGLQHPAAAVSPQASNLSALLGVSPDGSNTAVLRNPVINPRVRFAPLGGRKTPAELGGRKPPPAALDGRKTPASVLDGRKTPAELGGRKPPPAALANPFAAQTAPVTLVDGLILLALATLLWVPARKTSLQCK